MNSEKKKKENKDIAKQDFFLKLILDEESDKLNEIVRFSGMSDEERLKLMTVIRGFAVVVARRFAKVKVGINSAILLLAAILAYAVANNLQK